MALGLPAGNNYTFNSSANIAPSFHVGPRMYSDAGIILHPLQRFLGYFNTQGAGTGTIAPPPNRSSMLAGYNGTSPGGAAFDAAHPHPYTVNGRQF